MRKTITLMIFSMMALFIAACGEDDELHILEVEFIHPDTADVGEKVELKALVTYGDEAVTDADEVVFEVWEKNDQENSQMLDATNEGDGSYTVEVSFDHDGIFEMYAHTTARDMHTMPKREIIVGEGGEYEDDEASVYHTEGFDMHFVDLDQAKVNEEQELIVHLQIHEEPLADASVRYEIWNEDMGDDRDWVDAEETEAGEYIGHYSFEEATNYQIQVHVEDDEDLHEHNIFEVSIGE